jgi:hypothetical protein
VSCVGPSHSWAAKQSACLRRCTCPPLDTTETLCVQVLRAPGPQRDQRVRGAGDGAAGQEVGEAGRGAGLLLVARRPHPVSPTPALTLFVVLRVRRGMLFSNPAGWPRACTLSPLCLLDTVGRYTCQSRWPQTSRTAGQGSGVLLAILYLLNPACTAPCRCAYQVEQGGGNLPARLSLMAFPERTELRQKNLFSVAGARPRVGALSQSLEVSNCHLPASFASCCCTRGAATSQCDCCLGAAVRRMTHCAMRPTGLLQRYSSRTVS